MDEQRTHAPSADPAEAARFLDARGLYCPEPVFRTKTEMDLLNHGDVLEVLADDPAAEEDIKRWVERTGNGLLLFERRERDLRFLIRKKR